VEKDTAPVLWYVLVASLVLRFGGGVRQWLLQRPTGVRPMRSYGRSSLIPTKTIGNEYRRAILARQRKARLLEAAPEVSV